MRRVGQAVLAVLAVYLLGRGIAEFWVIDLSDPSTYRNDWGGPSLIGVLAVHSGPAVLMLGWLAQGLTTRHKERLS